MWPLQGSPELEGEKHKLGGNWSDRKAHLARGRTMCRGRYEKEVTPYHWGSPWTSPRENSYLGVSKKCISVHFERPGKEIEAVMMTHLLFHILHQP